MGVDTSRTWCGYVPKWSSIGSEMVVDRFGTYRWVPRDVSRGISVKGADRFRTYLPPTSERIDDHLGTYRHYVRNVSADVIHPSSSLFVRSPLHKRMHRCSRMHARPPFLFAPSSLPAREMLQFIIRCKSSFMISPFVTDDVTSIPFDRASARRMA